MSVFEDLVNFTIKYPETTNYIDTKAGLKEKYESNKFKVVCENPVLMIERLESYNKLYYFVKDYNDIDWRYARERICDYENTYSEVVSSEDNYKTPAILEQLNFIEYGVYLRKSVKANSKKYRELVDVLYGEESDAVEITEMLNRTFDSMADRIPSTSKLEEEINNNEVLKVCIANKIVGVLIFEEQGKRSYISCLCVDEQYQNSVIGYSLMARFFNSHTEADTKLIYLWVNSANNAVLKLHNMFGFKEDGLKNYIYKRRAD